MSLRQVFQTFENVSSTPGRNAKIALLDELFKEDPITFKEVVEYTFCPFWTYRLAAPDVSRIPVEFEDMNDTQSGLLWGGVVSVLSQLCRRQVELADGRSQLTILVATGPALYRKYLAQIINRDLKIGVQSFDKWFPGMIPAEPVMLCEKYDGENLNGEWTAEPKLDGYRSAVEVVADMCNAISRGNKEFWNWEHIALQISELEVGNVTLDGEFYAGNFGLTGSICKTQSRHPRAKELKYHIFDMLTQEEWRSRKCTRTTAERKQAAYDFFWSKGFRPVEGSVDLVSTEYSNIVYVVGIPVHNPDEYNDAADMFYKQGYEGTVLKEMSSVYVWDRSSLWLKIKPEEDCDVTVIGVKEGKNKHVGRLGSFLVAGTVTYKKKQYDIRAAVGGGLEDHERDFYWQKHIAGGIREVHPLDKEFFTTCLEGLVIEVRFQDVTTEVSMSTSYPSIRFPKFLRVRLDKTPIELGGK